MKTKDFLLATLYNMTIIICWVVLAVVFTKWWLALFAALFISWPRVVNRHYRICDKCGAYSEPAATRVEAIIKAKAAGWTHIEEGNKDYCPDCWNGAHK